MCELLFALAAYVVCLHIKKHVRYATEKHIYFVTAIYYSLPILKRHCRIWSYIF